MENASPFNSEWLTRKKIIDGRLKAAGRKIMLFPAGKPLFKCNGYAVEELETASGPADTLCLDGHVAQLFKLFRQIEARFRKGKEQVDSLIQSILAKAFGGDLVTTEAELAKAAGHGFESAEELLKRIESVGARDGVPRPNAGSKQDLTS